MRLRMLYQNNAGQVLTSVVIFMAFGLSVIALSAALSVINMQNTMKYSESAKALNYAEAGAEEGILRLIRDPEYGKDVAGNYIEKYLSLDGVLIAINISDYVDSAECKAEKKCKNVTSAVTYNSFTKKISAAVATVDLVDLAEGKVTLISWKEEMI